MTNPAQPTESVSNEFYRINEDKNLPKIDKQSDNLCTSAGCPDGLTSGETQIYNKLFADMQNILSSEPPCLGDGNLDKVVNYRDIDLWTFFSIISHGDESQQNLTSSWYDLNLDGFTDLKDFKIIREHFGNNCNSPQKPHSGGHD